MKILDPPLVQLPLARLGLGWFSFPPREALQAARRRGRGRGRPSTVDGRGTAWGGVSAGRSRVGWVLKIAIATTRYVVNLGLCRGAEGASCKTNFGVQKSQIFLPLRGDSIPVIQHPEWHSSFSW